MKKLKLTLLTILIGFTSLVKAQLITSNTLTPQQLVQNVLLGAGVTASNITYTGTAVQIAKFSATPSTSLGLAHGILISSGNALTSDPDGPQGPNTSAGTTTAFNNDGDPDLDAISGNSTYDAAILEFDFVPTGDSLKFRYFFGSEEYPEYVNQGVNDAFGFFLTGPNPSGGNYTNKNIALLPGTTMAVSINNVNATTNNSFYRSNTGNAINCEFDGLTKVLYALEKVTCGQTYHIKIAIGDGGTAINPDYTYDSGVFLEGGSFSSAPPISLNSSNANSSITDSLLYEGCNTYCVKFIRNNNIALKDSFQLVVGGNAINGSDYASLTGTVTSNMVWPTKMVFQANQDTFKICNIKILDEAIAEGLDTLIFTVAKYASSTSSCAQTNSVTLKVYLSDYHSINIGAKDSVICNSSSITLNASPSNGTQPYNYAWQPGNINTSTFTTPLITQATTYSITVNDICNKPITKVITITPSTLPIISAVPSVTFCLDSVKQVAVDISGGKPSYNIQWLIPANGVTPFNMINSTYYFMKQDIPTDGTYTITVNDQCNKKDTITINLNIIDCTVIVPNVITANGDGVNDYFKINGIEGFPNSEVNVFNRWGKRVYTSSNYQNDWKPDDNTGTYFYVIQLSDGRKFNGFVQILN